MRPVPWQAGKERMGKSRSGSQAKGPGSRPSADMEEAGSVPAPDLQLVLFLRVHELHGVPPTATVRTGQLSRRGLMSPCPQQRQCSQPTTTHSMNHLDMHAYNRAVWRVIAAPPGHHLRHPSNCCVPAGHCLA